MTFFTAGPRALLENLVITTKPTIIAKTTMAPTHTMTTLVVGKFSLSFWIVFESEKIINKFTPLVQFRYRHLTWPRLKVFCLERAVMRVVTWEIAQERLCACHDLNHKQENEKNHVK